MASTNQSRMDLLKRAAADKPGIIGLSGGLPDPRLFPKRELGDAFFRALHEPGASLQYGWPEGEPQLRAWIAGRLRRVGACVDASDVIVTNGAQQAISLATRVLFSKGQTVGLTEASYPGAIEAFTGAGLDLVPWTRRASGYYLMPAIGNPGGRGMSADDRFDVLRRLAAEDSILIEDDAYADSRFDGRPSAPLLAAAPERVIHVGTLSKVLCPGLRVGWLATKHPAFPQMLAEKQRSDLQAPSLTQRIVSEYLSGAHFEQHLLSVRRIYRNRAMLLLDAVRSVLPNFSVEEPEGGFSLWLEHRDPGVRVDDVALLRAAIERGVTFDPGSSFRFGHSRRLALRLCYSSVERRDIERGVVRLAEALTDVQERSSPRSTASNDNVSSGGSFEVNSEVSAPNSSSLAARLASGDDINERQRGMQS